MAVGVGGCSVGSSTPLLPFPKSPHVTAPGVLLTHVYLPTALRPLPVGLAAGGGGKGDWGVTPSVSVEVIPLLGRVCFADIPVACGFTVSAASVGVGWSTLL